MRHKTVEGMVRSISINLLFHEKKSQIGTNYWENLKPLVKDPQEKIRKDVLCNFFV